MRKQYSQTDSKKRRREVRLNEGEEDCYRFCFCYHRFASHRVVIFILKKKYKNKKISKKREKSAKVLLIIDSRDIKEIQICVSLLLSQ
jgi:hypothetical protein